MVGVRAREAGAVEPLHVGGETPRCWAYRLRWTTMVVPSGAVAMTSASRSPEPPEDVDVGVPVAFEETGDEAFELLAGHAVGARERGYWLPFAGAARSGDGPLGDIPSPLGRWTNCASSR